MAVITTYALLLTSIADRLHRTDLTSAIPEWVADAETVMNYGNGDDIDGLRTSSQEAITTLTTVAGTQTVALPTDWVGTRKLYITVGGIRYEMVQRPTLPMGADEISNIQSIPRTYIIVASNLYLFPKPDAAYTLTMDYYQKIGPLATQLTNWLLTMSPNTYRSGAIAMSGGWLGTAFNLDPFIVQFKLGLKQLAAQDMSRFDNVTLRSEVTPLIRSNQFNILTGQ